VATLDNGGPDLSTPVPPILPQTFGPDDMGGDAVRSNLVPMSFLSPDPGQPGDTEQTAADICRGVGRLLRAHGMASLAEVQLANGRRADVVAIATDGEIWIAEIKSSLEDYRADGKWPEYRAFCDRLFFAVGPAFPREALPGDTGLIIADRYGGEVVRDAPAHRLASARRKAMTLRLVHTAALRLQAIIDPEGGFAC
jgi:hypothetical protein